LCDAHSEEALRRSFAAFRLLELVNEANRGSAI
jgi:hypothetical protein